MRKKYNYEKVKKATKMLLEGIGDDPNREGLKETPDRVAKMYEKILNGYDDDVEKYTKTFKAESRNMVIVKDIPIYSYCEHHLVPFAGTISVSYIPEKKMIGLSKLVRIARVFCKRPQVQERLTKQIADALTKCLSKDVAVYIEAEHMCMSMRGVRTPGTKTITSEMRGHFLTVPSAKEEFLFSIRR